MNSKVPNRMETLLSTILLNSTVVSIVHILLYCIQFLQVLALVLDFKQILNLNTQILSSLFLEYCNIIIFIFQIIFLGLLSILLIKKPNQSDGMYQDFIYENYILKLVQNTISIGLHIYRKILLIPTLWISLHYLFGVSQEGPEQITLSIINCCIFIGILFPLSGMTFWNKIAFKQNIQSYPYKLNVQSLLYFYLPLVVLFRFYALNIVIYTNILFMTSCLIIIYLRPALTFKNNKINAFGNYVVISALISSSFYQIFGIYIDSIGVFFCFFILAMILSWMLYNTQIKRMTTLLLHHPQKTLYSNLIAWGYDENLFFHIANYQNYQSELLLFLFSQNQQLKNNANQELIKQEGSSNNILQKFEMPTFERQMFGIIQKIIQQLKSKNLSGKQIKSLFYQFINLKYKAKYNPKFILDSNLGKKQICQKLSDCQKLKLIIPQLLMFEQQNFRKCYSLIKTHEKLQKRLSLSTFLEKVEIMTLVKMIQEDLQLKCKNAQHYNLKAQKYFVFQKKHDELKQQILRSCDNRIDFWKQANHKQPNNQKIKQMIQKNHVYGSKIQLLSFQIIKNFESKSPLVLFDLISAYSSMILNKKVFSSLNPFYGLVKKFKEQLQKHQKQGQLNIQDSSMIKFSLLQSIGVCLLDLQKQIGRITWANQYFWRYFYGKNVGESQKQQQSTIFQIMVPQLKDKHFVYLANFSQSTNLNYNHHDAFVFQSQSKLIQSVQMYIQLLPNVSQGLQVSIFIFKIPILQDDQRFTIVVKDDFSVVGYTKQFLFLKQQFIVMENRNSQFFGPQIQYLSNAVAQNQNFLQLLNNYPSKDKPSNEITLNMQGSQFRVTLKRVHQLKGQEKQKQQTSSLSQSIQMRRGSQFLYFLQFQKVFLKTKVERINIASVQSHSSRKHATTNQQIKYMDSRTYESQISNVNSDNNQRNFNKVAQDQKQFNIVVEQAQKKGNKSQVQQKMQKSYYNLMFSKSPKKVRCWICSTSLVMVLIFFAILANIFIFNQRKLIYEQKKYLIKYFNQLITDIGQITIALRQYNYYVQLNGPDDPHIPLLIRQVNTEQDQIQFKLKYLSSYFKQKWDAIQVLSNGQLFIKEQQSYIVIANYMLSSITYISEVKPIDMAFPIFLGEIFGQPISATQVNFVQAVYNGIYVVLVNLSAAKWSFLPLILKDLSEISNQIFIYPCISGLFLLILFSIASILIQKKSQNVRQKTVELLTKVNYKLKVLKIEQLEQFRNKSFPKINQTTKDYKEEGPIHIQKAISSIIQRNKKRNVKKIALTSSLVSYDQNQTKRDLAQKQLSQLDIPQSQLDHKHQVKKQQSQETQYCRIGPKIILVQDRAQKYKTCFYFVICLPSLIYFILMLIGGIKIDYEMIKNYEMGSLIHNKKSNQELAFLMTRQTFYFQTVLALDPNWSENYIKVIQEIYNQDRKLQKMIYEHPESQNVQKVIKKIQHGNLCEQMHYFSESVYYDVKFTKEECEGVSGEIMKQGFKPAQIWLLEAAVYLLNKVPNPASLSKEQKLSYLQSQQIRTMKVILAYAQILMDLLDDALEEDLQVQINGYQSTIVVYSGLSIAGLLILFVAVNYRWKCLKKQRKYIKSIVGLVSLDSIKSNPSLTKCFNKIDLNFYK